MANPGRCPGLAWPCPVGAQERISSEWRCVKVDARGIFPSLEPAQGAAGACVPRPLQIGGGQWRGSRWPLFQNCGGLHSPQSGKVRLGGGRHRQAAAELALEQLRCLRRGGVPDWLETGLVLKAFQLSEDSRGGKAYAGYLEARAKDRKGVVSDEALAELRTGWYLGEKSFADKILARISGAADSGRKKGSVGGQVARAHDEAEAERIVAKALAAMGLPGDTANLTGRGKWKLEKELVAALVRKRTGIANAWVAARLGMGHEVSVTRAVRRTREDNAARAKLNELEAKLGI